jgi:hypothetical protein
MEMWWNWQTPWPKDQNFNEFAKAVWSFRCWRMRSSAATAVDKLPFSRQASTVREAKPQAPALAAVAGAEENDHDRTARIDSEGTKQPRTMTTP